MTTIDQTVQALFSKLNQRKAVLTQLKQQQAKSWKTNGTFRMLGATSTTNIQTAPKEVIEEIALQLCMYEQAQGAVSERLNRTVEVKIQNYSLDDWFSDITKRLSVIDIRSEEATVAQLETRLNQVLSPEERRRIEVELLAKELNLE